MKGKGIDRSARLTLAILAVASAVIWMLNGPHPIYVFGWSAVFWLLGLMIKGILSRPFKPWPDELPPPNSQP